MFLFFLIIAVTFLLICTGGGNSQDSSDFIAESFEADKEDDLNRRSSVLYGGIDGLLDDAHASTSFSFDDSFGDSFDDSFSDSFDDSFSDSTL